jgi:hypothetical protein
MSDEPEPAQPEPEPNPEPAEEPSHAGAEDADEETRPPVEPDAPDA